MRGRPAASPPQESCGAYIIPEPCIGTKDSACVDVCPVDCIHPRKDEPEFETAEQLFIHPDECIDCGACVPACPVEAIFALDEAQEKGKTVFRINAQNKKKKERGGAARGARANRNPLAFLRPGGSAPMRW